MSRPKRKDEAINLTKPELLSGLTEDDALKKLMKTLLQEVLEAEMDQTLHAGLKRNWQRCYVHFLCNALDYLPRKHSDDCLTELRWLYDRHTVEEARGDLAQWLARWQDKHPKLCAWVETNIDETFAFYRLPREHHKHLKSNNMLERNQTSHALGAHLPRRAGLPAAGARPSSWISTGNEPPPRHGTAPRPPQTTPCSSAQSRLAINPGAGKGLTPLSLLPIP